MHSQTTKDEQSKDDSSNEKQDAIERRRLQNRLSQRNHRRKIRDRIAKLQERVIASELRAVASLNGWDQASPSAASMMESKPQGDFDSSPLASASEDPAISNATQRNVSSSLCRSCCSLLNQMPGSSPLPSPPSPLPFDLGLADGVGSANSSSSTLLNSSSSSSQLSPFGLDASLTMTGLHTPNEFNYPPYPDPPGSQQYPHCPHYYVATEASLPHIMQTLGSATSHPKAIILIPHGHGYSPTPFTGANAADSTGLRSTLNGNLNLQNPGCHCLRQDRSSKSSDLGTSVEWMNAPSSTPLCPLHPSQSSSLDSFQSMML
ncbi:hypothetical protein IFM58399_01114 [Aspergillus lentulus]|uniref:BZIP domain-containing protein n=1 Tax=Aspergillus lentulus TaxID=293939 RepID=A0ABQ0ZUZ2_ASPLE|nr:uncharacterized protein IFM58399_01114 [Aspergillus lentulus]GFF25656.1 hypothetical protein IFM58399_01114 [Aspergillus lentulus]GFF44667.1 hypothetical protein IFM62136_00051 [Aspergillus lentulus]GFF61805.1 hypothetical protein IFM60648_00404 [Aspergillus lentulus]GFF65029.1 hypothetical protein IFM47457_00895 [Aspergillus lentulus]GFG00710.1 hypothetical protein IFM61392_01483 [Aspergillus lentulus]